MIGYNGMTRTGFEKLRVYQLAEEITDLVWEVVLKWDSFPQSTIGKQLVNSLQKLIKELTPKLSAYIKSIGNNQKTGK